MIGMFSKRNIADVWENSPLDLSRKDTHRFAMVIMTARFSGGNQKELLSYKVQQEDILPSDFDPSKYNVVIFSSSEEEFAAIQWI